jgi:hypothetical protein
MNTRRCSVCGRAGHDRRRHQKPIRRNLDAFVGSGGVIHPIRGSDGYDGSVAGAQSAPLTSGKQIGFTRVGGM